MQTGSIIFGEYLENVKAIKNGKLYVLVTKQDGIVFKRIFNFAEDNNKLLLVSDNRQYSPYTVDVEDVLEIWVAKAFFSNQFPDPQGAGVTNDHLAHTIVQLQEEIGRLKKK
jgi:hypothetical protein